MPLNLNELSVLKRKRIAILGSTGSIGTQALEVIFAHPDEFEVEVLTAQSNAPLLIEQARRFQPNAVVICNEEHYALVKEALRDQPIKVFAGQRSLADVVTMDTVDLVLTALVGYSGLKPTIKAIEAGKDIALANKETLVVAGKLVTSLARERGVNIYPIDSEHSAIFQCIVGEFHNRIHKLILTASGGPFRGKTREEVRFATKEQALRHPNWTMGPKITIDSATMMNKGLEVIEAHWLFGVLPSQVEVVIHPQSVIHSMVEFVDGSIKAQLGWPDMRLPIQFALTYPRRLKSDVPRFDFLSNPLLTFEKPDFETFRNLALAYEAVNKGGNAPCVLNAANEVAVAEFLKDKVGFLEMSDIVEQCLQKIPYIESPSYDDYVDTDRETRLRALELVKH